VVLASKPPSWPLISSIQQEEQLGRPIVIQWSTESEVNTAGFNIYRAESEAGPWIQINDRLIPGSLDPLRGSSYVFTDTEVLAGKTYWYELEEVELGGKTTRLERTQATAKSAGNLLTDLPCPAGALLVLVLGAVLAGTAPRRGI
jgi:hypothetical protein